MRVLHRQGQRRRLRRARTLGGSGATNRVAELPTALRRVMSEEAHTIVPIGAELIGQIRACYNTKSKLSPMLWGAHGIGKSEIFHAAARELGIECRVIDLAGLDPSDQMGLPYIRDGRTEHATWERLPREGAGLLLLEEFTRSRSAVRAASYQLLSARQLNSYRLPPGWLPCATSNPVGNDYEVGPLDSALKDRFCEIYCRADEREWLRWARESDLHPAIIRTVENMQGALTGPASPRGWFLASRLLKNAIAMALSRRARLSLLEGVLKSARLARTVEWVREHLLPPSAREAVGDEALHQRGRPEFGRQSHTTVPLGPEVVGQLRTCYEEKIPPMLWGSHGIGKSEIFHTVARELGIECRIIDLAALDPSDQMGLPYIRDGRTEHATWERLPREGAGLLVLEEITRARSSVRSTAYQLLSARRLNSYRLPDGWLPCATSNPVGSDSDVAPLDAALLDRFCEIRCHADESEWLRWARQNNLHDAVLRTVEHAGGAFAGLATPRGWTKASELLESPDTLALSRVTRLSLFEGVLKDARLARALERVRDDKRPLEPREVLDQYDLFRKTVQGWPELGRLDLLDATIRSLQGYILHQDGANSVAAGTRAEHLRRFLDDLPGDLRHRMKIVLPLDHDDLSPETPSEGGPRGTT